MLVNMLAKKTYLFITLVLFSGVLFAAEEKLEVTAKKAGLPGSAKVQELLTLNGMRQAITNELIRSELDSEAFWKKLEEKNLSDADEASLLRARFNAVALAMVEIPVAPAPLPGQPQVAPVEDPYFRGTLIYDLDSLKVKNLFNEIAGNLLDYSLKTFYIVPEITIAKEMTWDDVGVTKADNFSGVIVESWKKWAANSFKQYPNVVVLNKDFTARPENLNAESVTLKWNSYLKKAEVFPDRKSARYELSAQYVMVNSKTGQSMLAFDFPTQKKEYGTQNPKELSSNLASLIYNLLNSQTAKISSNLELNRATPALGAVDIKVVGKHGLYDITLINSFLSTQFKDFSMTGELKSYASEASVIRVKSTQTPDALYALLGKEGGKWPLNEQKILLFSSENKTFAIIPKEANN